MAPLDTLTREASPPGFAPRPTRNPPRETTCDVAILGGGLAGLSLAARLATPRFAHLRVVVLETRATYVRDRTWCYWRTKPHPFEAAVSHRWDTWTVARDGAVADCAAPGITYECIPADRFYDLALARIAASPNVELRRGIRATPAEDADGVTLPGANLRARLTIDTRPPQRLGQHGLAQKFLGLEIETERPVFDPGRATLMDLHASPGGVHFTYVLPTTPTRALVEDAWFARPGTPDPDHRAALAAWLRAHDAGAHRVLFEESGCLPMDPVFRPAPTSRVCPLGGAAGAHRPATGYAFAAVQDQCDFVASHLDAALAAGAMPPLPRRAPAVRAMDAIMLAALRRAPTLAPRLFFGLFTHCDPGRLVRFMADRPGPTDMGAVIWATARGLTGL